MRKVVGSSGGVSLLGGSRNHRRHCRPGLFGPAQLPAFLARAAVAAIALSSLAGRADAQYIPDLVSKTSFRVCADPSDLPFSNRKAQGFENKIAEIFAQQLKEPLRYFWAPSGPGFARNTLNADFCDVIMGYSIGAETVLSTNPYYRSTYVIVAKKGSALNGVETLDDPKLRGHKLGVFAATAPTNVMLAKGLMTDAQVYPLLVDHRFDSPLNTILSDLDAGKIDAAIVWGPLVGWDVVKSKGELVMTPLLKEVSEPGFAFRISLGVRRDEVDWKHKLEAVLRTRRIDINKVLVDYGVPLLDDDGHLITPAEAVSATAPVPTTGGEGEQASGAVGRRAPPSGFHMPGPAPANVPPGFHMPGPAPTNAKP